VTRFWPVAESAQADYEALRKRALSADDSAPLDVAAARFQRLGLAGLILGPSSAPVWVPSLIGAQRPRWSPHSDPRREALADCYAEVVGAARFALPLLLCKEALP
jgi:hypothetical protein